MMDGNAAWSATAQPGRPTRWWAGWKRLDHRLFEWAGGGHRARPVPLRLACATARWSWLPLLLLLGTVLAAWHADGWSSLAQCLAVLTLVQVLSKRLARRWQVDRPFMVGLSPNHLGHSVRAGFPSTHATVMGAALGFTLLHPVADGLLLTGMALITMLTGWARVYAGAHFPLDVIAGTLLGVVCGALGASFF